MGKLITFVLSLFFICSFVQAQQFDEEREVRQSLEALYHASMNMRKLSDVSSTEGLKKCVSRFGYIRDQAKTLRAQASGFDKMGLRSPLVLAADAVFECGYCGGDGASCKNVPQDLKQFDDNIKTYKKAA